MRMTLEADYAVRIVECLTLQGKRCDASSISEQTEVPLRFSLKILRKLVQVPLRHKPYFHAHRLPFIIVGKGKIGADGG